MTNNDKLYTCAKSHSILTISLLQKIKVFVFDLLAIFEMIFALEKENFS